MCAPPRCQQLPVMVLVGKSQVGKELPTTTSSNLAWEKHLVSEMVP